MCVRERSMCEREKCVRVCEREKVCDRERERCRKHNKKKKK